MSKSEVKKCIDMLDSILSIFTVDQITALSKARSKGIDIPDCIDESVLPKTMVVLFKYLGLGIDLSPYIKDYRDDKLEKIGACLEDGVTNIEKYIKPNYTSAAIEEIGKMLKLGVADPSIYIDDNCQLGRFRCIRMFIEHNLDLTDLLEITNWDPKIDVVVNYGFDKNLDPSLYVKKEFDYNQMFEIAMGLNDGVDISVFADPKYDDMQMMIIRLGLRNGVDVSKFTDPDISWQGMSIISDTLEHFDIDCCEFIKTISEKEINEIYESVDHCDYSKIPGITNPTVVDPDEEYDAAE